MRYLKISTRLALGFSVIVVFMLIISASSLMRMLDTRDDNQNIIQRQSIAVDALKLEAEVKENIANTQAAAKLLYSSVDIDFNQTMEQAQQAAATLVKKLDDQIEDPEIRQVFTQLTALRDQFLQGRTAAFVDIKNGNDAAALKFFNDELPVIANNYLQQIDRLSNLQVNKVDTTLDANDRSIANGIAIISILSIIALILSPLFSWLITRSIIRPLNSAVRLTGFISNRDLTHDIHPSGKDEITTLEVSLHKMAADLQATVANIQEGANTIALASAQITAGNLDLASRTEQQASSLAETAASMEELTSTVSQNADNAKHANGLADTAASSAANSGVIVTSLVDTMSDINAKSQQMAEIVGVIDSIAFQTNILALNAAVEAARAGEQGRGFAVVASEVRALAQRSAASAKEIKSLIDAAVSVTNQGNEQASHAGASVESLVHDINQVSSIMGEISAASSEQTSGIEQINIAVTQMDDVTRQNASLVDESAAAAASLKDQADTLASLVATFKLNTTSQKQNRIIRQPEKAIDRSSEKDIQPPVIAKPKLALSTNKQEADWHEF